MNNYYFQKYMDYSPNYLEMFNECETKGEKKSIKERWIKDVKMQEYPKSQTKSIVDYIKGL